MPTKLNSALRPGLRRGASSVLLLAAVALALPILYGGCSATQLARAQAVETKIVADVSSPAGQQILADTTSAALNVGLDLASGNDVGAAIAGVQGAASAVRDYEGLPTAPSAATIASAAAAGSGVVSVAKGLAPSIESIIGSALTNAKIKGVSVPIDKITEAIARGLDAVAGAKVAILEGRAKHLAVVCLAGTPGEAP